MRSIRFALQPLLDLFDRLRAVTMPEMKAALGTQVDVTVFRKLATLPYQSSYSHRGAFYTLRSIPRFNAQGLWCCRGAWLIIGSARVAALKNSGLPFSRSRTCS